MEFNAVIRALKKCTPKKDKYTETKNNFKNKIFTREEKKLMKGLKTKYFHLIMMKHLKKDLDSKKKWKNLEKKKGLKKKKKKEASETKMVLLIMKRLID